MDAFVRFVTTEWYFAAPLFLMSFTALTLVIWRVLLNRKAQTDLSRFLPRFQEVLAHDGTDAAVEYCKRAPGLIAQKLFPAALEVRGQGVVAMRRAMASVIELEIQPELHFLLAPILALAKCATMVGLLLTVVSMINTFSAISAGPAAAGGVSSQAGAIGLALFATALGLVTAIPLVFAHVLFKDWIGRYELRMKSAAQKLLAMLQAAPAEPPAHAAKPAARPVHMN